MHLLGISDAKLCIFRNSSKNATILICFKVQLLRLSVFFRYFAQIFKTLNMKGMGTGLSTTSSEEEYDWLSNIIKVLNETYGVNLTDDDRVDLQHMREHVEGNDDLMSFFNPNNARDDVRLKFEEEIDSELLNFINT